MLTYYQYRKTLPSLIHSIEIFLKKYILRLKQSKMESKRESKVIYFVEGNIGAGKSEFLKHLNKDKFHILDEPMERFCNLAGQNPLDLFYKKQISGFHLSVYISSLLIDILLNQTRSDKLNIICRNVLTAVLCFAKINKNNNEMSELEYNILLEFVEIYKKLLQDYDVKVVFLDVDPDTCYSRLKKRNRKEEENVAFDYIKNLDIVYRDFIDALPYEKIVLNGNQNTNSIIEDFLNRV